MPIVRCMIRLAGVAALLVIVAGRVAQPPANAAMSRADDVAAKIQRDANFTGGLIVHLGCSDGRLTIALGAGHEGLVHGLDADATSVMTARSLIQSKGLNGRIAVDTIDDERLPYADRMVNLLVVENPELVPIAECMRVLAPYGAVYVKRVPNEESPVADGFLTVFDGQWAKHAKPWPEGMDEWTHHLHSAGGNAVAGDRIVSPPARLQWTAGPLWARSHGWTPSVSAMVSSRGRLFYICDETLTGADAAAPSKWFLVARDAFSGILLWKRPIPQWGSAAFSGTPDTGAGVTVGRFTMPPNVGKRLVAVDDTVFVTLGPTAPVTALNAATGQVARVYAETNNADEIIHCDGRLIVSINLPKIVADLPPGKQICAIDTQTGRLLWKEGRFSGIRASIGQDPFGRLELAAGDNRVFALTTESIECLDAETGARVWRIDRPALPPDAVRRIGFAGMYEYLLAVLVYKDGVVLLAQPEPNTHHTYHTMPGALYAFDAEDGRQMWKHGYGGWGHCTPPDVFVVNGVVWSHVNAETEFGSVWQNGLRARDSSQVDYRIQALDLRSGELRQEHSTRDIFNVGHHHRCYRNKITERFLLSCRRGVEFVDLDTGENFQNHWVRSGCLLGYLPCNGLLYVTPHPCGCYINAKLTGFNALAGAEQGSQRVERSESRRVEASRKEESVSHLLKGPAYGDVDVTSAGRDSLADWPTYRHDERRSGSTESSVEAALSVRWQVGLCTKPSSMTVAGGKAFVADVDSHTVYAINADDGRPVWSYTVGARVDSPPTLYNGLAIFGSADGRVYCLRAVDGTLVWQFDAAPQRRLVTAFGQLESPWPVPGSVLVEDGKCWFAAGRSSYLDGGIRLYALQASTGEVLYSQTIYNPDPETGSMPPEPDAQKMVGLLNDIPVSDGANIFIRQMQIGSSDSAGGQYVSTTGGYLDSSWFNRTFWQAGRAKTSGLMVLGEDAAFGVELYESRSREAVFRPGTSRYRLQCIPLKAPPAKQVAKARRNQMPAARWEHHLGIRVTALVRAADTIFVAGSPDVVDPLDPDAAWEGRLGGLWTALSAADGKPLAPVKSLPAPPVWDGMAAADGRLYISMTDGTVACLAADGGE